MVGDNIIAIDPAIDGRDGFEGFDDSFDEEGHEAQFHSVTGHEAVLEELAEIHNLRHVHFVKSGQDGGGLLGVDEVRGDLFAQRRHALTGGAPGLIADRRSGWCGLCRGDGKVDFRSRNRGRGRPGRLACKRHGSLPGCGGRSGGFCRCGG